MVGIDAGREFKQLHNIDQFALCGISPTIKLTFQELLKQAIRVAALLHDDFRKPQGVISPFSSTVANDLKDWLQAQVSDEEKSRAVRRFYANTSRFRGLVWQPYLKGRNGKLLPRTDAAIWQRPEDEPLHKSSADQSERSKRDWSDVEQDEALIPERKRSRYASTPGFREQVHWGGPRSSENGTSVNERQRSTYASKPGTREDFRRNKRAASPPPSSTRPSDSSFSMDWTKAAKYSIDQLFALAEMAGDKSRRRVAIACLPDRQGRIVTIGPDIANGLITYRVEDIDVRGCYVGPENVHGVKITFRRLVRQRHVFLGRFIGETERELHEFASAMEVAKWSPIWRCEF